MDGHRGAPHEGSLSASAQSSSPSGWIFLGSLVHRNRAAEMNVRVRFSLGSVSTTDAGPFSMSRP
jgi:hypothetical protein